LGSAPFVPGSGKVGRPCARMQSAYFSACVSADPELLGLGEEPHAASATAQAASAAVRRAGGIARLLCMRRRITSRSQRLIAGRRRAVSIRAAPGATCSVACRWARERRGLLLICAVMALMKIRSRIGMPGMRSEQLAS
jgi:hypothetical protein